MADSAQQRKLYYDKHTIVHSFVPIDPVWLFIPTRQIATKKAGQMENCGDQKSNKSKNY